MYRLVLVSGLRGAATASNIPLNRDKCTADAPCKDLYNFISILTAFLSQDGFGLCYSPKPYEIL